MQQAAEQERQYHLKRLHARISNYCMSPLSKTKLREAYTQLIQSIEMKFNQSSLNKNYKFPRTCEIQQDENSECQIVNLNQRNQHQMSSFLSVAEESLTNQIPPSESILLMQKSYQKIEQNPCKKLKIKLFRKENELSNDRLKTQYNTDKNDSLVQKIHKKYHGKQKECFQIPPSKVNLGNLKLKLQESEKKSNRYLHTRYKTEITDSSPMNKKLATSFEKKTNPLKSTGKKNHCKSMNKTQTLKSVLSKAEISFSTRNKFGRTSEKQNSKPPLSSTIKLPIEKKVNTLKIY